MPSSSFDIDQIVRHSPAQYCHFVESTSSTNDLAKKFAKSDQYDDRLPLLIVTADQVAGRGRQGKTWWSGPGSLTFSLLLDGEQAQTSALVAVAAAVSLATSIENFGPRLRAMIKWPNDIYLTEKKVAGILIESVRSTTNQRLVIGIGVNLNCSLRDAPEEVRKSSTTILDHLGDVIDPSLFLIDFINRMVQSLDSINCDPKLLVNSLSQRSLWPKGTPITVRINPQTIKTGQFAGFGTQGQLILRIGSELVPVLSGSIENSIVE